MTRGTIVVAGAIAQRRGYGGHAWVFLQYLLGFRRLGFDVLFLDRFGSGADGGAERAALLETMRGFDVPVAIVGDDGDVIGSDRPDLVRELAESSLLLNVMGFLDDEELLAAAPRRAFLDIDPGFGQMWRALGLADIFDGHDAFFTVGENVGKPECTVPACGIEWVATRPPVVLSEWGVSSEPEDAITTVASWRGPFAPVEYEGQRYGLRVHEFRRFLELPQRTGSRFELALDIDAADAGDLTALARHGWNLVDPTRVAHDVESYRRYVQDSRAELMIAKGMYVQTRCGWFSDRSVCYLASGRPVLAQDTGFTDHYPTGDGLVPFTTLDEAVEGIERIQGEYPRHAAAARELAEQYFDSDVVLAELLANLGID